MEVAEIYYRAKDGKIFTDPIQCEEYEKNIGIIPGSVGALIQYLGELEPKTYIFGMVLVKENGAIQANLTPTICCDRLLQDYVNVSDLREDQRYIYSTVEDLVRMLKKTDKDYPCEWIIMFSNDINFKKFGIMSLHNQQIWEKAKKK